MIYKTIKLSAILILAIAGCNRPEAPLAHSLHANVRRTAWGNNDRGVQLTTRHYRIFSTARNPALINALPGFMEAAYDNYLLLTALTDSEENRNMPVYILGSRQEWSAITREKFGRRGEPLQSIEAGGYMYDKVCVLWDMGGLGTLATAAHEGLHQFLAHRMRHSLPLWLEEGLCASTEGYQFIGGGVAFTPNDNGPRFNNLRRALLRGLWIPTKKLLPMDAGDVIEKTTEQAVGYYGQLWALSVYLRTTPKYRGSFARLLADAEAGRLNQAVGLTPATMDLYRRDRKFYNRTISEPIFRHYFSDDLEGFDREYRSFARKLAGIN